MKTESAAAGAPSSGSNATSADHVQPCLGVHAHGAGESRRVLVVAAVDHLVEILQPLVPRQHRGGVRLAPAEQRLDHLQVAGAEVEVFRPRARPAPARFVTRSNCPVVPPADVLEQAELDERGEGVRS